MIEINSEIYQALAGRLQEEIGNAEYFNGTVEYETEEFYSTLTLTAIVYRRTQSLPEGDRRLIANVVPVWWNFSTTQQTGDTINDFSFSELKPYLIEYE